MNQQGQCTHKRYVSQMCTISTQLLHQIETETYFGSLCLSNYVGNGFPPPTIEVYLPCPRWPWGLPTLPFIRYWVLFFQEERGSKAAGARSWSLSNAHNNNTRNPTSIPSQRIWSGSNNFTFPNHVLHCTCGLSNNSGSITLHNISGRFPSKGYKSALYNKIRHDLCSNKSLVHFDEGWMMGLASISEPESHAGASLATRQAFGDLPTTETLVLQVENGGWQPRTHTKILMFSILRWCQPEWRNTVEVVKAWIRLWYKSEAEEEERKQK